MDFPALWIWLENDSYPKTEAYTNVLNNFTNKNLNDWFPSTKVLFLEAELEWDRDGTPSIWAREHINLCYLIIFVYLVTIFWIKFSMESRERFDFRRLQCVWNIFLAIFSIWGASRMLPYLLATLYYDGFDEVLCTNPLQGYGRKGPSGLWTFLFIYSKVPELLDTVFIVLAKRKLLFLHWYHHVTVLLFCWHAYGTRSSAGIFFVAINFTVHALMYSYYALMDISSLALMRAKTAADPKAAAASALALRKALSVAAPFITLAQISQMAIGIWVMYCVWLKFSEGSVCHTSRTNWLAGLLMYASYFVLFVVFAFDRYILPLFSPKSKIKEL